VWVCKNIYPALLHDDPNRWGITHAGYYLGLLGGDAKTLFTSSVFEGIGGDYLTSRKIPDRLFIMLGLEGIISGYPHKSLSY
jgi:hypothetical protein